MMKKIAPYFAVFIFFIVALKVDFTELKWKKNEVFYYDTFGYHNYLPAFFIYHDITQYKFIDSIELKYRPTGNTFNKYGLLEVPKTPNLCNQYPIGVAIFQLPLFMIAHWWTIVSKQDIADGYSSPYQHATVFSTLLFAILALVLLISLLKNYFSNAVIFCTILLIAFGTNFFQYATLESGLSHIYLFFLYSAVLYLSHKWHLKANTIYSILLGICIGLCAITRPLDILVCLIPLCWQHATVSKTDYLKTNWKQVALIVVITFIATLPQLFYWKHVTHQWVYYSYSENDYFQFDRFRLIHGLLSYRKGWFIYTPLVLIASISLFYIPKNLNLTFYKRLCFIFFVPMIYLVFSWHNWFYGWSFGCRALLQTIPLFAIPLAFLVERIFRSKMLSKTMYSILFSFIIFLNLFQTWQYNEGIIHGTLMNEAIYWDVFLTTKPKPNMSENYQLQEQLDWQMGGW